MENTAKSASSVEKDYVYMTVEEWTCGEKVDDKDVAGLREEALSLENPIILTDYEDWVVLREEAKKEEMEEEEEMEDIETPEDLASEWMELKHQEEVAYKKRLQIEAKIVEMLGVQDEGSKTHSIAEFKVRVTGKMNRKLDIEKWEDLKNEIPAEFSPVEYKPQLSNSKLKEMILKDPSAYRKMCKCITSKPAKPYVSIVTK